MSKNGIYTPLDFKNVDFNVSIDEVGVGDRLARIKSRSIKKASKVEATLMAINMIDLTTLEGMDSPAKVRQLCSKAMRPHEELVLLALVPLGPAGAVWRFVSARQ